MDKTNIARRLVVRYLESCVASDPEHEEEFSVSIECLKTIWAIQDTSVPLPGVNSLIDLIPDRTIDKERGVQLKLEGNAALRDGNYDLALAKYTEAIAADPTEPTFYCNRAAVRSKQGEHALAIPDCQKAIELDPKYATAYSRLGFAHFSLNQNDKAREAYERGIRACPDNQQLRDNLNSLPALPPPPAGFENNPMFAGIAERLKSPEVEALLQDPEMAGIVAQLQSNPAALLSMMGDPRVARLIQAVMGGGPRQ
jgi:tetratricopeptide (TPR) repeat protein